MFSPIKVLDIELSHPVTSVHGLEGYRFLQVLVLLHGTPIGYIKTPVSSGSCSASAIRETILNQYGTQITRHLICDAIAAEPRRSGLDMDALLTTSHPVPGMPLPTVTVAVCTRDRPADLARCLDSLQCLEYANLEIIIVDNAPSSHASERLVHTYYPGMRYFCESRPGLDWARNRAIMESLGEIIAFTDDDVVVHPGWIHALAAAFAEKPEVMAVTGLVVPYELETEAQLLFEQHGGFGRGFVRKWARVARENGESFPYHGTGQFGTGANMAFRRNLFDKIGGFDPALDVGTVTNGGGDLEMFFRVLKEGYLLLYEPRAIVRHRHRRNYAELRSQITNWGIAFYAYLVRSASAYPDERIAFIRFGIRWLWRHMRQLFISLFRSSRLGRDLILAELYGSIIGLFRYQKACDAAANIVRTFGPQTEALEARKSVPQKTGLPHRIAIAVRTVDLANQLQELTDVQDYNYVRIYVNRNGRPLGSVDITHSGQAVTLTRMREAIVDKLYLKLLQDDNSRNKISLRAFLASGPKTADTAPSGQVKSELQDKLPREVSVSVVLPTYDRPDDLRNCLQCLATQKSERKIEIIVVDNHPSSGLTPPVVAHFPGVTLVNEQRKGLSYARNKGFTASRGDILVATDDDVTMPEDWLEKLVAPFVRSDVMIVTGNVFPLELETKAQILFEVYGGLGKGFEAFEANANWFNAFRRSAVPTWKLGATANAAFRASIFTHPQIGLMDEALGPGTPSGVGEDTYLFYRVLKAGYTILYEPAVYVWHKHRRDITALRRQLYNYSKGHVAYHLTTLTRDRDMRALVHLAVHMPKWRIRQLLGKITGLVRGRTAYPLSLILLEIAGNLAGPWALWRARRRVKIDGRSEAYTPAGERIGTLEISRPPDSLEGVKE